MSTRRTPTFAHPWAMALVALAGVALSWLVAVQRPVPGWELSLTRWVNDVPDAVAAASYPVMQLGTLSAPLLVALAILVFRRDLTLAFATICAGLAAWFLAKGVKDIVERGRPPEYVDVDMREGTASGFGYISGHAAVAAATAVLAIAALPPRWRPLPAVLAAIVGVARIFHGVHLPADVVGGWSIGALVGLVAVTLVDRFSSAA